MRQFFNWLKQNPATKLNFILSGLLLIFIPGSVYLPENDLGLKLPLVRPAAELSLAVSAYPVQVNPVLPPLLSARSGIAIDADSKTIIFQKNPDLKLLPASTTKIMTALVVLDNFKLTDVVTVGDVKTEENLMGLELGEKISVENLLFGLLIYSANDAALALAEFYPGREKEFVRAMNQKAKDLHLEDTQYTNPVGWDSFGQYTTVHDLSLLTAAALSRPELGRIVKIANLTVTDVDGKIEHELKNINELLGKVPGVSGVKTGWTQLAGECLVALTQRDGRNLITVVLGSSDRFGETTSLINWVFENFSWESQPAIHW